MRKRHLRGVLIAAALLIPVALYGQGIGVGVGVDDVKYGKHVPGQPQAQGCLLINGTTTNCLLISGTTTNALLVR